MSENKRLSPPTHLDPLYLYEKYEPLRRSIYKKFKDTMINNADREDLMSNIDIIFFQLVSEYDPNRGVDFPFFIKKMLDLRTYHFVTKYIKNLNNESFSDEELIIEDNSFDDIIGKIIDLNSVDPNIVLGDKHRKLMVGLLIEKKSLKELADEEGVPPDRLHARLYFLLQKCRKEHDKIEEIYGKDLY